MVGAVFCCLWGRCIVLFCPRWGVFTLMVSLLGLGFGGVKTC